MCLGFLTSCHNTSQPDTGTFQNTSTMQMIDDVVTMSLDTSALSELVYNNQLSLDLTYSGDVAEVTLSPGDILPFGFSGDIELTSHNDKEYTIIFSNISLHGDEQYLIIKSGTAKGTDNRYATGFKTDTFSLNMSHHNVSLSIEEDFGDTVQEGDVISFSLNYEGNIKSISLEESDIQLNGFIGDIQIHETDTNIRTVTISDIKGRGNGRYISINEGTAIDTTDQYVNSAITKRFNIVSAENDIGQNDLLTISPPQPKDIAEGETVSFVLSYSERVTEIALEEEHIILKGFTGETELTETGINEYTITISNIKKTSDVSYIYIPKGSALSSEGNLINGAESDSFSISDANTGNGIKGVYLSVSLSSSNKIYEGDAVSFILNYSGAEHIMNLTEGHIGLYGFTGDISITEMSSNKVKVTISDVQGKGDKKYITINSGSAISKVDMSLANGVKSSSFIIL